MYQLSKKMWLYDIHVYPKNLIHEDGPDIDKDVIQEGNNDAGVDMYAPFAWIIKTSVPTDISSAKVYKITDKLDERLEFVNIDDMKVVIKDKDGNLIMIIILLMTKEHLLGISQALLSWLVFQMDM